MQDRASAASLLTRTAIAAAVLTLLFTFAWPRVAQAQYNAPPLSGLAIGERYHVELTGSLWNPGLAGVISSEDFGLAGTDLDLVNDLGFQQTRFTDVRFVVRPARKHRLRFQYTPISYTASTTFVRDIVFNGQKFTAKLPVTTSFDWKVARFGYEYDVLYLNRGFVGVFAEGRYTQFDASLDAPLLSLHEFTSAKAPVPAIGMAARGYVLPNVALNFEVSGFQLPSSLSTKYQGNYYDWDINGTVNLTNYFGIQLGWRRMTTALDINQTQGNFQFQGIWFGASVRY